MRIAILTGGLPPVYSGGAEIAALHIAAHAAKVGHEMHVIAMGDEDTTRYHEGVALHELHCPRARYLRGTAYIPKALIKVQQIVPDLIHAQSVYCLPAAAVVKMVLGIPYLFYERGGIHITMPLKSVVYALGMGYAQRIIAQTDYQKAALARYTKRNIEVIPNGVDADRFSGKSKPAARQALGLDMAAHVVLSVGRCRPEKNLGCLVRAALMDRNGSTEYIVVGDGPEMERLGKTQTRVRFVGRESGDHLANYFAAADVFVNTSNSEGFPLAILEAMAAGLPIVAPRICGIADIVGSNGGIFTAPGSAEDTHRAIRTILGASNMAAEMGLANRHRARSYTWDNVVRRLYN